MRSHRDLPLWLSMVIWAFLPSTWTPWVELGGIPVSITTILIYALLAYYALVARYSGAGGGVDRATATTTWVFCLAVGYGLLSLTWSRCRGADVPAMAFTLVTSLATFFLARAALSGRSTEQISSFLILLAWFTGFTGLVYFSESFLGLGVRSVEGREASSYGFGVQRVHGPLFGAASGYFLLLPAIGLTLDAAMSRRPPIVANLIVLLALASTLIGLGSRGALLALGCFVILYQFASRSAKSKVLGLITVAVVGCVAAVLIYSQANADRIADFQDTSRQSNHVVALRIAASRGLDWLAGLGYGDLWAWYLPDVQDGGARSTGRYYLWTQHGYLLFNPHSILLMLGVELGVVGLIFFAKLLKVPAVLLLRTRRMRRFAGLSSGIAASCLAFFLDFPIFKYWPMSLLWWLFVLGALRLTADRAPAASSMQADFPCG